MHCTSSIPRPWKSGIPEVRGRAAHGTLWALLFYSPPAAVGVEEKIVLRMTGSGPIHVVGIGPDGQRVAPAWGPEAHGSSNWDRPGAEWGTGWRFPSAGCWHLHARRAHASGNVWLSVGSAGIVQSAAAARTVRVSGSVPVAYVTSISNPDTGLSYRFTGKGRVHPFGMVRITGTAQSPGFIREATPVGEFRLVNQQGSVTLRLVYPKTPGFAPLPSHGKFLIVAATGAYAGDSGGGTFTSDLSHAICNAASLITHLRCRGTGTFHFTNST